MKPLRVGIAGLGTVGASVARILVEQGASLATRCGRPLQLAAVSARQKGKDRGFSMAGVAWFDDPVDMASMAPIDLYVELMGGEGGAAKASVEAAIARGVPVVTANKALLAHHGAALAMAAEKSNLALNFEAAVAGGIPIIKALREGLGANRISRVYGILNGTCNYILTTMEATGRSFADVLAEAQKLGYAEADPTFDIGGMDTAHKLSLLAAVAFGNAPALDGIHVEGIERITPDDIAFADEFGYRIKLLGLATRSGPPGAGRRRPHAGRRRWCVQRCRRGRRPCGKVRVRGARRRGRAHGLGRHGRYSRHRTRCALTRLRRTRRRAAAARNRTPRKPRWGLLPQVHGHRPAGRHRRAVPLPGGPGDIHRIHVAAQQGARRSRPRCHDHA